MRIVLFRFQIFFLAFGCLTIATPQEPRPRPDREDRRRIRVEAIARSGPAGLPAQVESATPSPNSVGVGPPSALTDLAGGHPSDNWLEIESHHVSFGEVVPGEGVQKPGAIVVRVHSSQPWELKLSAERQLQVADAGKSVPRDRLLWRSGPGGEYSPFENPAPVRVAEGAPTTGAGALVIVDLLLLLKDTDPLGSYHTDLRLLLNLLP